VLESPETSHQRPGPQRPQQLRGTHRPRPRYFWHFGAQRFGRLELERFRCMAGFRVIRVEPGPTTCRLLCSAVHGALSLNCALGALGLELGRLRVCTTGRNASCEHRLEPHARQHSTPRSRIAPNLEGKSHDPARLTRTRSRSSRRVRVAKGADPRRHAPS
jgi:hypothetical protein